MAAALAGDELIRSMSIRRASLQSSSKRSWASTSFREVWTGQGDVFQKSGREDDEEELRWAAIERLPTYDRLRKGILKQVLDNGRVGKRLMLPILACKARNNSLRVFSRLWKKIMKSSFLG